MRVRFVSLLLLATAASCAVPAKRPRLVVLLVGDQFGDELLGAARPHFAKDGIERLFREGASFTEAHYGHAMTYTAPGHACLVTGTYGHRNGIIGNNFYDRGLGKSVSMLADSAYTMLGEATGPDDDTSPARLVAETLGDRLRAASPRSRVVAIGGKERSTILLAGQAGTAWWLSDATGRVTTSTWYANELPQWVVAFNERRIPDACLGRAWERTLPPAPYSGDDDRPWESAKVYGRTFPHLLGERGDATFYKAFSMTPMANELLVELAKAAVTAEDLGADDATDLLAVTFSANDLIGHAFGPESHEALDAAVRLDRSVAELVSFLEKRLGGSRELLVVFTADHGSAPSPESVGQRAGRVKRPALEAAVNAALGARFGEGEWVRAIEDPGIYLNEDLVSRRKLDLAEVQEVAGTAALSVPGVAAFQTSTQLSKGEGGPAQRRSFFPSRSADVVLTLRPFHIIGKHADGSEGSTHGSPHRYDTHVPLVFWGARISPGIRRHPIDMSDVAPSLADQIGIGAPSSSEGRALQVGPTARRRSAAPRRSRGKLSIARRRARGVRPARRRRGSLHPACLGVAT